ncbi:helix-turn-helix domain-containing protein [Saccharopolyspora mangrovi]|uniref:Helix-turn-helix domain-containing protein n=1 Tax=Saccharopolyspora mangrovi TaxID=3082379 RepID=A0ABU6A3E8_9PSEU|nr:helix-turn-helix domain-containing protein [Saccharopolyspora sp. S2-29]MEB3366101.1 helix-turn-helix domain-containing protein [Saccharopolyspora sp. S2-29]
MSKAGRPEAIVRPKAGERAFEVERLAPDPALAEFVDYYWLVRWNVVGEHRQQVVPQPRVHVAAEHGRLLVHGISREPFFRTLRGSGHVLGAAFHPGGFRALLRGSVGCLSGTVRPAGDVLGHDDRPAAEQILATSETARIVPVFDAYLLACEPEPDPTGRQVTELVEEVQRRSDIVRAEQLAQHAGLSLRSLQRLFADHVGVGPKWVVQRCRILDATAAAHSGEPVDWSELAAQLGFSDQAHLTRAFTQVVGTSPATYRRDPDTTG